MTLSAYFFSYFFFPALTCCLFHPCKTVSSSLRHHGDFVLSWHPYISTIIIVSQISKNKHQLSQMCHYLLLPWQPGMVTGDSASQSSSLFIDQQDWKRQECIHKEQHALSHHQLKHTHMHTYTVDFSKCVKH